MPWKTSIEMGIFVDNKMTSTIQFSLPSLRARVRLVCTKFDFEKNVPPATTINVLRFSLYHLYEKKREKKNKNCVSVAFFCLSIHFSLSLFWFSPSFHTYTTLIQAQHSLSLHTEFTWNNHKIVIAHDNDGRISFTLAMVICSTTRTTTTTNKSPSFRWKMTDRIVWIISSVLHLILVEPSQRMGGGTEKKNKRLTWPYAS